MAANFNTALYGYLAVYFSFVLFNVDGLFSSVFIAFSIYELGFLSRPLGALLFGLLGDKVGRKFSLIASLTLIGIPTILMGLMPFTTFFADNVIFYLAFCVFFQGIFMSGEYTGLILKVCEDGRPDNTGKRSSVVISAGVLGALLAAIVCTILVLEDLPLWTWRVVFIGGGGLSLVLYFYLRDISETREFKRAHLSDDAWLITSEFLKLYGGKLIFGALLGGLTVVPLYCSTVLGNKIFQKFGYTFSQGISFNVLALVVVALVISAYGKLADRIGFTNHILLSCLMITLFSITGFFMLSQNADFWCIVGFIILLNLAGTAINGCAMPYLASLFPVHCRYLGVALSLALGHAFIGGTTPLFGMYLWATFDNLIIISLWPTVLSILVAGGIVVFEQKKLTAVNKTASSKPI